MIGGIVYGFLLGFLFYYLILVIDDYFMELLLMIGILIVGYVFVDVIYVFGLFVMVVFGIMIGNWICFIGFLKESEEYFDYFWEFVDEFFNGVLFLLIGMLMLLFEFY